jgi:hypothetical protein
LPDLIEALNEEAIVELKSLFALIDHMTLGAFFTLHLIAIELSLQQDIAGYVVLYSGSYRFTTQ